MRTGEEKQNKKNTWKENQQSIFFYNLSWTNKNVLIWLILNNNNNNNKKFVLVFDRMLVEEIQNLSTGTITALNSELYGNS